MNHRLPAYFLISAALCAPRHPTHGLVGYWSFDEGSGTVARDGSGSGRDGQIRGAVWTRGKRGTALRFDGTASVEVPNHPSLEITDDITIAAWIWKERPNQAARWDAIVSKSPGKWDYELLTSKARSDEVAFFTPKGEPREVYSGKPVPTGRWCHVAVTRAGREVRFYMDGVLVNRVIMAGAFTRSGGALQIGLDGAKQVNGMIGLIDEVYLYSRALSESEIRQLM